MPSSELWHCVLTTKEKEIQADCVGTKIKQITMLPPHHTAGATTPGPRVWKYSHVGLMYMGTAIALEPH